tara:strand:+ start:501 stop:755 length:255 start_codon:yes stop_codon:yes gene_type:complete
MDKIIKCLLLDVDNVIISEIEEVGADVGEPDCKLINPFLFESVDNMKPWPKATDQKELLIRSDNILTMADPTKAVINRYLELTK